MKLASAKADQVVRNTNNASHYRFERLERGKARIWPLELFPNGLLISKPTPTLVESDINVAVIGMWTEDMVVEGKPSCSRRVYENELVKLELRMVELEAGYELLPAAGKGKQSRGSWKNKLNNCEARIVTLKRGLGFVDSTLMMHAQVEDAALDLKKNDKVQMPSGRIGAVVGFQPMGDQTYVKVKTMLKQVIVTAAVPYEVLRPAHQARFCTI